MPCYDERDASWERGHAAAMREVGPVVAIACAAYATLLNMSAMHRVRWAEAGVTEEEARVWYSKHLEADRARRQREEEENTRIAKLRKKMSEHFTDEDLALLGYVKEGD